MDQKKQPEVRVFPHGIDVIGLRGKAAEEFPRGCAAQCLMQPSSQLPCPWDSRTFSGRKALLQLDQGKPQFQNEFPRAIRYAMSGLGKQKCNNPTGYHVCRGVLGMLPPRPHGIFRAV